jgi:hypothetical protein
MNSLHRRLPGVRIEVAPPPAEQALPRMDVAVLVGFASTGPLHLPVAVESAGQFASVFGADAPLAWDAVSGERVRAHLGAAVRAFFANGGTRCWVVRVARSASLEALRPGMSLEDAATLQDVAQTNHHAVPGVLAVKSANGSLQVAIAPSRCEGSWSDRLRLSSALQRRSVAIDGIVGEAPSTGLRAPLRFHSTQALQVGDLLQFGDTTKTCAYAVVDAVHPSAVGRGHVVHAHVLAAFRHLLHVVAALPESGVVSWIELETDVAGSLTAPASQGALAQIELDVPLPARGPARCDWAQWRSGGVLVWLRIDDISRRPWLPASPPPADASAGRAVLTGPAWLELGVVLPADLRDESVAHVLTLELRADDGAEGGRLRGVGLTPAHPASWWQQPTDAERYRPRDASSDDGQATPLAAPGFPLAAQMEPATHAWLPLGVQALLGEALAPLPQANTALERDGLSRFDADLFLDPELADATVGHLVQEADAIRSLRDPQRTLFGLHAALGIGSGGMFNEASLIALPDSVHLGWQQRKVPTPAVVQAKAPNSPLFWQTHRGGCVPATKPDEAQKTALSEPDFGSFLDCGTRLVASPRLEGPAEPQLPGPIQLDWEALEEPGADFILEEARQADFVDARQVYRGPANSFNVLVPQEGHYLYRVYAESGDQRSAASNTVQVEVRSSEWVQIDPANAGPEKLDLLETRWLTVHRAALRLGAATGEMFAVLALPRHFRTPHVLRYANKLRSVRAASATDSGDPEAFSASEAAALSYGALFHPWLQANFGAPQFDAQRGNVVALQRRTPRVMPPDGVSIGVLAARASTRGAWVAPANELLKDVVALAPAAPAADLQALQNAQVNVVRVDPRGLFALSADTLANDVDLRPINVRRLLILLRRLALQRGNRHVFEPLGPVLRRAVQRGFDELLTDLFRRGAFAGATPEQSFRVVTDDTVNTMQDADGGRFVIELRVAPALPMRFITVRLTQSGERLSVVEQT